MNTSIVWAVMASVMFAYGAQAETATGSPADGASEATSTGLPRVQSSAKDRAAPELDEVRPRMERLAATLVAALPPAQPSHIERLAVLPLRAGDEGARDQRLGLIASELLASALADQSEVEQVERLRIDELVGEMKWAENALVDSSSAVPIGRLLGATRILVGTVVSTEGAFLVFARIVDVESGEILSGASEEVPRSRFLALAEDVVEVKSRAGAIARSAVLPGWGQVYGGSAWRGATYAVLFAGAGGAAASFALAGSRAEDAYHQNTPETVHERARGNELYRNAEYALLAMAGIWTVAIVDAAITGRDVTELDRSRLQIAPGGLAWRF